jgi:hypothetical protein
MTSLSHVILWHQCDKCLDQNVVAQCVTPPPRDLCGVCLRRVPPFLLGLEISISLNEFTSQVPVCGHGSSCSCCGYRSKVF